MFTSVLSSASLLTHPNFACSPGFSSLTVSESIDLTCSLKRYTVRGLPERPLTVDDGV